MLKHKGRCYRETHLKNTAQYLKCIYVFVIKIRPALHPWNDSCWCLSWVLIISALMFSGSMINLSYLYHCFRELFQVLAHEPTCFAFHSRHFLSEPVPVFCLFMWIYRSRLILASWIHLSTSEHKTQVPFVWGLPLWVNTNLSLPQTHFPVHTIVPTSLTQHQ